MKLENNWKYKSLIHLQKIKESSSNEYPSKLIIRCAELLRVPLNEFQIEDLRIMIGQQIGLDYLVPLAIEKLRDDLFAEGDCYPGDLLSSVLKLHPAFWQQNKNLHQQINSLIKDRCDDLGEAQIYLTVFDNSLK